jgi:hypothetical protein
VNQILARIIFLFALCAALQCRANAAAAAAPPPDAWVDDLRPIAAADWNRERVAHLLRRVGFGATPQDIEQTLAMGPRAAVTALVRPDTSDDPALAAFQPSGIPDAGIDPFPESRPLATDIAKARGEALGIQVKPSGNRRLQTVLAREDPVAAMCIGEMEFAEA